jgi:hypothetical protein
MRPVASIEDIVQILVNGQAFVLTVKASSITVSTVNLPLDGNPVHLSVKR